jgi:hypothetical protein
MIEIRLSTEPSDNTLLTFDGKVLEFFSVVTREVPASTSLRSQLSKLSWTPRAGTG